MLSDPNPVNWYHSLYFHFLHPRHTRMSLRALEFFSGIGGLHAALKQVKPDSTIVSSFDINPNAYKVYPYSISAECVDIITITPMSPIFRRISLESRPHYLPSPYS